MKKIPMDIVALSHSVTQSHNYAVVLGEKHGRRRLPIIIGAFEAQAIAVAWERMAPNRPLTHDLFKSMMDTFKVDLREVIINNLLDGVFYAQLICYRDNIRYEIDSRTSDALAMAVRFQCPIYTYEFILEAAGVVLEEQEDERRPQPAAPSPSRREKEPQGKEKEKEKDKEGGLNTLSIDDLNKKLEDVLSKEDYKQAAQIRDEINRRKTR
jgi:bifunctional DNase/RNase